jgi:hypothetical protein
VTFAVTSPTVMVVTIDHQIAVDPTPGLIPKLVSTVVITSPAPRRQGRGRAGELGPWLAGELGRVAVGGGVGRSLGG